MEKLNKEEFVPTIVNFGLDWLCIFVFVRQNMTQKRTTANKKTSWVCVLVESADCIFLVYQLGAVVRVYLLFKVERKKALQFLSSF